MIWMNDGVGYHTSKTNSEYRHRLARPILELQPKYGSVPSVTESDQ